MMSWSKAPTLIPTNCSVLRTPTILLSIIRYNNAIIVLHRKPIIHLKISQASLLATPGLICINKNTLALSVHRNGTKFAIHLRCIAH